MALFTYTVVFAPFDRFLLNLQEVINELFIWFMGYYMLLFTDWVPDELTVKRTGKNLKNSFGFAMLVIMCVYMAIHLLIIAIALVMELKKKCIFFFHFCRRIQNKEPLEAKQQTQEIEDKQKDQSEKAADSDDEESRKEYR